MGVFLCSIIPHFEQWLLAASSISTKSTSYLGLAAAIIKSYSSQYYVFARKLVKKLEERRTKKGTNPSLIASFCADAKIHGFGPPNAFSLRLINP